MSNKRYHYTYVLKRVWDGSFYIGVRSSVCPPDHDTSYMSSSKSVRSDILSGTVYKKKILAVWTSRKKALAHEIELHTKHQVGANPKFLNLVKQTATGFDRTGVDPWNKGLKGAQEAWNKGLPEPEHLRIAKSIRQKGRRVSDEAKANIRSSWTPEKRAEQSDRNSGARNPRAGVKLSDETKLRMSEGWTSELRKAKSAWAKENSPTKNPEVAAKVSAKLKGVPKSEAHRAALRNSKSPEGLAAISKRLTGSEWITDGLTTRRLSVGARMPRGFAFGKLPETKFVHPKFPEVSKMKSHWSRWANENLDERKARKFINQLQRET